MVREGSHEKNKICWLFALLASVVLVSAAFAAPKQQTASSKQHQQPALRWVSLSTDSRDTVREIIRSEVDSRESFSTRQEEKTNLKVVEDEKEKEDSDYKNAIVAAKKEFVRAKKKRDDLTSQFHMVSTDLDESAKGIKNIRATIEIWTGRSAAINRIFRPTGAQTLAFDGKTGEIAWPSFTRLPGRPRPGEADVASAARCRSPGTMFNPAMINNGDSRLHPRYGGGHGKWNNETHPLNWKRV